MKRKRTFPPYATVRRSPYYNFLTRRGGQIGYGMPVFRGRRYQRGHGIGNVLGGLFRRVVGFLGGRGMDFLKQNRQAAVSNLLKTGVNIVKDVSSGKKVKDTLKTRIPEGIKQTASQLKFQSGDKKSTQQHRKTAATAAAARRPITAVRPTKSRRGPKILYTQPKAKPKAKPKPDIFS